jgi:glycosyltransferase involved in cell wall biosynthesis
MIRTCTVLHNEGHTVCLIGRTKNDSLPLQPRDFSQKRLTCWFQKGKFFYLEYNIRLFWYLLFQSSDVLCSVDLDTSLPGKWLKKYKKWRWIIDSHEWFPYVPEVARRPRIQQFWLWVEALVIPAADEVYTVGNAIAKELQKQYAREVKVVRNAPFLASQSQQEELPPEIKLPNQPFILYQGAVNEGRGLERLLDLLEHAQFHLVIAGEGDILKELQYRVLHSELNGRVHFLGFVSPAVLPLLTQRARVGYNVSEAVSKSYELSLNNKFFDYAHALLPSVINDFVEYRNLCEEFEVGILVNHDNTAIFDALHVLMTNDIQYERYRENCKKAREVWNWQTESRILQQIYGHV